MSHYCHCLIYNVLERQYTHDRGFNKPEDIDISIKDALTTRNSSSFYGETFPYFDPVGMLLETKYLKTMHYYYKIINNAIPERLKYIVLTALSILAWYIDFIKDIIIAEDLSYLYTSVSDFKSQVVILMWVTVFLSQTLIGIKVFMSVCKDPSTLFGSQIR